MSIQTFINQSEFEKVLMPLLNEEMKKAAEPILQKALLDIEEKMREVMAQRLIGFIQTNFSIERMGHDLRIIIRQAINDKGIE